MKKYIIAARKMHGRPGISKARYLGASLG